MSLEQDLPPSSHEERPEILRRLAHEIKSHLGVVTMGMQALKLVREDPDEFAEIHKSIEKEGVEPLKAIVAQIVDLALSETD
ncbi:hypothetical protein CA54_31760 [Symmachiella macrocystis]|uniref:Signal transduction histidine kinase dimerisation/phosphoacceptor domain-containing protein n=1 Tax=Symmachiella macrocystis TaxID=2527985 RepID=A0A5C6BSC0_9PLAN|nr:hypothetical protein [Symmachiella macrocystis]TWU14331.1 hypothetical protein CA54_31760 [Symmachiella macrocystis]